MKRSRHHHEAWWALVIQGVGIVVVTPLAWGVRDGFVAVSLLLGGLACLAPNIYLYRRLFKHRGARNAYKMVNALYWGEALKFAFVAVFFATIAIGIQNQHVSFVRPLYLFVGFFYAQLIFWVGPLVYGFYLHPKRSALNEYD